MRPTHKSPILSSLLIALLQLPPRPASADEVAKPSKSLAEHCQKLSNEANYSAALEACERASEQDPDPGIVAYIAQIQTALLHPVQARDALNRYLAGSLSDANRKMATAQLRYLETLIGTLRVELQAGLENPELRIDDQVVDAKLLARGLPFSTGAHQVTLKSGGATFSQFVVLRAGEVTRIEMPGSGFISVRSSTPQVRVYIDDQEVSALQAGSGVPSKAGSHRVSCRSGKNAWPDTRVTVKPGERASVVCSAPPASPAVRSMNPRGYWVAGAGLLLGGAALATAIYNGNEYDRWQTANDGLRRDILAQDLPLSEQARRAQENNDLMNSIETRRNVTLGLGIAGGLVTAGGVVLLFADSAKFEQERAASWFGKFATRVSFGAGPNSGQISWRGAW